MTSGTSGGKMIIRPAEERDCDAIFRLIKELAEYEKMPDQVTITTDILKRDGFGEEKFFHCMVAVETKDDDGHSEDVIVGYALYHYAYSTWQGRVLYVEDIYVTPNNRRKGLGSRFWKELAQVAIKKECQRMQFVVLNWNVPSINFYKAKGSFDLTVDEKWHLFRMNRPEIEKLAQ